MLNSVLRVGIHRQPRYKKPIVTLTLAAVIVWAGSAIGLASGSGSFDDVPAEHWAEESIAWALANGVTVGVGDAQFDPEGLATRAQMATFLYRTVNLLQGNRITAHSAKGTIAFASKRHRYTSKPYRSTEIFIMNADGGNVRQLTYNDFPTWSPSWSPDGAMIAYMGFENYGQAEIYVLNVRDATSRRLTYNNDEGHHDGDPSWSPDGARIAFTSDRDGDQEIYTMNADGTNFRQLTDNDHGGLSPAWSPDGALIAFHSDWRRPRSVNWDGPDIFLMNADGTRLRQLTPEYSSNHAPGGPPGGVDLTVVKTENGGSYNPSWSPDGARIAFTSDLDSSTEIFLMNADGTGRRQLTHNNRHFEIEGLSSSWSPDGAQILISGSDPQGTLSIINVDGTDQRQITHSDHDYWISSSAWSPHTPGAGSEFYDDVPEGHWAEEEIGWVTTSGVSPEVGKDRFGPDGTVTRAQIAVFLHRAAQFVVASAVCGPDTDWLRCSETAERLNNSPQDWRLNNTTQSSGSELFNDVSRADPADEAIGWAAKNGIITGVTKSLFDPGGPVSRAEMVTFLHKTAIVLQQS